MSVLDKNPRNHRIVCRLTTNIDRHLVSEKYIEETEFFFIQKGFMIVDLHRKVLEDSDSISLLFSGAA
jgi:hypothetical protein